MGLIFLGFLAFFGLMIWASVRQARQARANLQALAQRLGFVYTFDKYARRTAADTVTGRNPRREATLVKGQQAGREAAFYGFSTGTGKSTQAWRAVSVRPKATGPLTFNLHQQGLGSKIEALFGTKEAIVGDPAFDAAWFLQTSDPDFLGAALLPEVQAKLTAAVRGAGRAFSFRLADGVVRYAEAGTFSSEPACARLEQILPVLHDLADIAEVAAARGATSPTA